MSVTLKSAVEKMKQDPHAKYFFFFCEKGEKGKPVILADSKKIDPAKDDRAKALLDQPKPPASIGGSMHVASGILHLIPKGQGLSKNKLKTGAMIAAGNAQLFDLIQSVEVGEAEEDTPEAPPKRAETQPQTLVGASKVQPGDSAHLQAPTETGTQRFERAIAQLQDLLGKETDPKKHGEIAALLEKKKQQLQVFQHQEELHEKTIPHLQELLANEADPAKKEAISILIEKKENELAALTGQTLPERIDKTIDPTQQQLNQHGFVPKAMGSEYVGEDKKRGWRAGDAPQPPQPIDGESPEAFAKRQSDYQQNLARWERMRDSQVEVTKYYTEEERQQAKLHVDEKGLLRDSAGRLLASKDMDYVVDEQGQMYQAQRGVVRQTNELVDDPLYGGKTKQYEYEHHASVLAGKSVTGAGGIEFTKEGLISRISNKSGHYKPGVAQMIQTVETLLKNRALLDREWVDKDGQPLSAQALQMYEGILMLQDKIMVELADNDFANITKHQDTVDKAKKMLVKLGCGPSNRVNKATVAFLELKDSMQGKEVITSQVTSEKGAQEFLRSGAGYRDAPKEIRAELTALQQQLAGLPANKPEKLAEREAIEKRIKEIEKAYPTQQQVKDTVLKNLEEKMASKKADFDREADQRAQNVGQEMAGKGLGVENPSTDDMQGMVANLVKYIDKLDKNAFFTPDTMPAHFAEYEFKHLGKTAAELAEKYGKPLEVIWKETKAELAKSAATKPRSDADVVKGFEEKYGSVKDLATNVKAFMRIPFAEVPELKPLILKRFNLAPDKLDKWLGKGLVNLAELFDKLDDSDGNDMPAEGRFRLLFLAELAEAEEPAFVNEVKAFEQKHGPIQELADDPDRFTKIQIKSSGLIPLILKRLEPFGLTADKLQKMLSKNQYLDFFDLFDKIDTSGNDFDVLFAGHFKMTNN